MDSKQLGDKIKKDSIDKNEYLSSLGPELFNLIKNNMEKVQKMDDGEEKERLVKEILIAINKKTDTNVENDSTAFKYQNKVNGFSEPEKDKIDNIFEISTTKQIKKYDPMELISEIMVSIVGLIILWIVGIFWNKLFLKEGTSIIGYVIYFIGWMYLFVTFSKNLLSLIKKIILIIKHSQNKSNYWDS